MSQRNQCCTDTEPFTEELDVACQVRLYSPHPGMNMVMMLVDSDLVVPSRMIGIANQAVAAFNINPCAVIWIECVLARADDPACAVFHLINFDWQAGLSSQPQRLPIDEHWYLSWLAAALHPSAPSYAS